MLRRTTTTTLALAALALTLTAACEHDECSTTADCDDAVFCNGDETCLGGRCVASGFRDCDDRRPCTDDLCDEGTSACLHLVTDRDGDGHFHPSCDGDDCDDTNPDVHPNAPEICDGLDDDCDGIVDEDRDDDGHFDPALCPGDGDDCDDEDPAAFPGAPDPCDGVDQNCSGGIDDEADTDRDGSIDVTCAGGDDCDDEDPAAFPGAAETCNGRDDDCDGSPDEGFDCAAGADTVCATDCGFLGTGPCTRDCQIPTGDDCVGPAESCDGLDNDCDGTIDDGFECAAGFETACVTAEGCAGVGTCTVECRAPDPSRCDPVDAPETCDGFDNDCDGLTDEGYLCAAGLASLCETECGTVGTGLCTPTCEPPTGDACSPPDEVCDDFVDNDCDGDEDCVDEDCIGDFACGA